jgi:predicted double-glycine peptidase
VLGTALALLAGGCGLGLRGARRPVVSADDGWLEVPGVALALQQSRTDCGAAALTSVLAYWRPGLTEGQVRQWVGPVDEEQGVLAGRLRQVARDQGLEAFIVEGQFADLVREVGHRRPVIAGVVNVIAGTAYPHYEVVVGVNPRDKKVLTADPALGWREQSFDAFEERWKLSRRLLLVVLPPEGSAPRADQQGALKPPGRG